MLVWAKGLECPGTAERFDVEVTTVGELDVRRLTPFDAYASTNALALRSIGVWDLEEARQALHVGCCSPSSSTETEQAPSSQHGYERRR